MGWVFVIWACIVIAVWAVLGAVAYALNTGHASPFAYVTIAAGVFTVVCGRATLLGRR